MTYNEIGLSVGLFLLFGFFLLGLIHLIHHNIRQYRDKRCVVCKNPVDWGLVREDFEDMLEQVDRLGVESLTENQQVVYECKCCSFECYENMNTVIIEV